MAFGKNGSGFNRKKTKNQSKYVYYGKNDMFRRLRKSKKKAKKQSPDAKLASITNQEFDIYKKDFLPVETELIAEATDEGAGNEAAEQALRDFNEGFGRQKSVFDRGIQRSGQRVNTAQQTKLDRQAGLAKAAGGVGAANLARRNKEAENDATVSDMVNAGQSLRGIALQGLGAAAGMQTQRDMQGRAAASQQKQGFMGNVATGAGLGWSVAGPVGGAVGAGVGALVSLF